MGGHDPEGIRGWGGAGGRLGHTEQSKVAMTLGAWEGGDGGEGQKGDSPWCSPWELGRDGGLLEEECRLWGLTLPQKGSR